MQFLQIPWTFWLSSPIAYHDRKFRFQQNSLRPPLGHVSGAAGLGTTSGRGHLSLVAFQRGGVGVDTTKGLGVVEEVDGM